MSTDLPELARDLLALDASERRDQTGRGISPSDVGALFPGGCKRQLAYREQGAVPTDPLPPEMVLASLVGTSVHDVVSRARTLAGWPIVEHFVQLPGLDRRGRLDGYRDGRVDDLKTKSSRGLRALLDRGKAYDGDQAQAELYAYALETVGTLGTAPDASDEEIARWSFIEGTWSHHDEPRPPQPVETVSVTYVSRDNPADSFTDSWTYERKRARRHLVKLAGLTDRVRQVPPERIERGGLRPDRRPCEGCPFRTRCWELTDVLPDGETPVTRSIRDEEAERLAADLVKLRAAEKEAKEGIEYVRAALANRNGMEFEDAEGIRRRVHWTKSKSEGGQLDQIAAAQIITEMGMVPPRLGTVSQLRTPAVADKPRRKR